MTRWFHIKTGEEVHPENIKFYPDLVHRLGRWCEVPACSCAPDRVYKDDRGRLWQVCEEHADYFVSVNDRR